MKNPDASGTSKPTVGRCKSAERLNAISFRKLLGPQKECVALESSRDLFHGQATPRVIGKSSAARWFALIGAVKKRLNVLIENERRSILAHTLRLRRTDHSRYRPHRHDSIGGKGGTRTPACSEASSCLWACTGQAQKCGAVRPLAVSGIGRIDCV
jgi:hypothetical protein